MIFVIVAVVATFIGFAVFWNSHNEITNFIGALVMGLIAAMLVSGFIRLLADEPGQGTTPVKHNLAVLVDGKSGTSGNFFLGIGSISSGDPKFSYYVSNNRGAFELHTTDADDASVVQEKGLTKPYAVEFCHTSDFSRLWSWPWPDIHKTHCYPNSDEVEFHVPTGSIKSNYTLDAQ